MATYELIETITLGSDAASVTFSAIPQTYTDLKMLCSLRCTRVGSGTDQGAVLLKFNNISGGGVYSSRMLRGSGTAASSLNTGTGYDGVYIGECASASNTANTFTSGEVYIPNYTGNTQKPVSVTMTSENNTAFAFMECVAGLWTGTAAATSLTIAEHNGTNYVSNSSFSLYGIKKA